MSEAAEALKGIPIIDNHVHLRPEGRMDEALAEFAHLGGKRILLVHAPYEDIPPSETGGFRNGYERTLATAERARKHGEVEVHVALGPHPAELLALEEALGLEEAVEVMKSGMEIAAQHVQEGAAMAIGEVGRPHFQVAETVWQASNELMTYGMKLAREVECPIILHTEEATPDMLKEIGKMADRVGLPRKKVVKHYCGPLVLPEENHGTFPSVLARNSWSQQAAEKGTRFLLETDYLDDPKRPGAVLSLKTVPKRCALLLSQGILGREELHRIHGDNVRELYGDRLTS